MYPVVFGIDRSWSTDLRLEEKELTAVSTLHESTFSSRALRDGLKVYWIPQGPNIITR